MQDFNAIHFDILKEIGNIGTGNAITAISTILNQKIDMNMPKVMFLEFKEVADAVNGAENPVFSILIHIDGDIQGIMMFLLEQYSACWLIEKLLGRQYKTFDDLQEIDISALEEVSNIMASSYLSALGTLADLKIKPSIPYRSFDMAGAILSVPAIEFGKVGDQVLFIESAFSGEDENVTGFFILVPELQSFTTIMKSLGVG